MRRRRGADAAEAARTSPAEVEVRGRRIAQRRQQLAYREASASPMTAKAEKPEAAIREYLRSQRASRRRDG